MTKEDILNIARLILTQCDGAISRDRKGYDNHDAVTVRELLSPDLFGISGLVDMEVEYLRRKLLRYTKQLRKIGGDYEYSEEQIDDLCRKLEEPICKNWGIAHGQVERGGPYGRISLKWPREGGDTNPYLRNWRFSGSWR